MIKIKTKNDALDNGLIEFDGKYIQGYVYDDGSGELAVRQTDIFAEDGLHKNRSKDIRKLAKRLNEAVKELDELETKLSAIKFKNRKIRGIK